MRLITRRLTQALAGQNQEGARTQRAFFMALDSLRLKILRSDGEQLKGK
jgi:hypothetical protein